jgi:hypothetical protein
MQFARKGLACVRVCARTERRRGSVQVKEVFAINARRTGGLVGTEHQRFETVKTIKNTHTPTPKALVFIFSIKPGIAN